MTPLPLPAPFDPRASELVRAPEAAEPGSWVGAPSVLVEGDRTWLTYRERRPRGRPSDRGWRCAVAVSRDGIRFDDVWEVRKEALDTPSIERFDLVADGEGYALYLSYVDPTDARWRIDVVRAAEPAHFDIANRRPVLTAASTGTEGVKDPVVVDLEGRRQILASFAAPRADLDPAAHATGDIYNVGATIHPTGIATIDADGVRWAGEVLSVGAPGSWDGYQARIGSVVPVDGGYVGLYDGSAAFTENYEERLGLATSRDGRSWLRRTPAAPWILGPSSSGSLRYADVVVRGRAWWTYHEATRPDGAHELRVGIVDAPG